MRILGLSGSLRRGSLNTALLRAAAQSLPSGVELEVYDGLRDLPHYDSDIDVDDIGLSRPSLDDVFLSLTGHRTEEEVQA